MNKIYTKEQVIKAIQLAQKCEHDCGGVYFYCTEIEEVIEELTPIQLPTDEEIYELAKEQYPISMEKFGNEMMDGNIHFRSIFIQGVEWMRDKIKGGDK